MDAVDRRLIEALRVAGRTSFAELARLVGMSSPGVTERVGRLERAGIITGYHAATDPSAVGLGVAALIGVQLSDGGDEDSVAGALELLAEVEDCWSVAGDESFVVKVRAPDVASLERTISRLRRIDGVSRTRTTVVLSSRWEGRVAPLPEVMSGAGAEG